MQINQKKDAQKLNALQFANSEYDDDGTNQNGNWRDEMKAEQKQKNKKRKKKNQKKNGDSESQSKTDDQPMAGVLGNERDFDKTQSTVGNARGDRFH